MSAASSSARAATTTAIRPAIPTDAPAIRTLEGLSASTLRLLEHDLGSTDRRCLVALDRAAQAGATRDGATRDGATRAGATRAGATRVGATRDGATRVGATRVCAMRTPAIVGYAAAILQDTDAHVIDIAVTPARRREGIGRGLLEALVDAGYRAGAVAVTLEVRASNLGSQALYRQLGFVDEGRRPRYYPDGEDALIWWLRPDSVVADPTAASHADPTPDDVEEVD